MHTAPSSFIHRTAFAAALLMAWSCAPAGYGSGSTGLVAAAGTSMRPPVVTTYTEAPTVSFALDRIDQHTLPLDRTYRRFGSGRGITVYVFDGGILAEHPEIQGRVRRGYDAFPNEEHLCNAHGTAVAGAVAGSTLGVAPDAEIVDVKMVECRKMRGTIDAIVRGAQWVIADHAQHPGRRAIANWSFVADTSVVQPALDSAVRQLNAAGIPVVVSAGNIEMNACRISPSNSPGAIVVGASRVRGAGAGDSTMLTDERAPGTAFGPCVDVFAPGDSVLLPSMDVRQRPSQQLWTGTSMAAGYVSGAVALFLEANPTATTAAVFAHVKTSSSLRVDEKSPSAGMLFVGLPPRVIARR